MPTKTRNLKTHEIFSWNVYSLTSMTALAQRTKYSSIVEAGSIKDKVNNNLFSLSMITYSYESQDLIIYPRIRKTFLCIKMFVLGLGIFYV
jgi:hypothetical protein